MDSEDSALWQSGLIVSIPEPKAINPEGQLWAAATAEL